MQAKIIRATASETVSLSFKKSPWLFERAYFRLRRSLWERGEKCNDVADKPRMTIYCYSFVTNGR